MDAADQLASALQKVRNLESAVSFMQKEHGATLAGLHGELSRLQERCADLTFQVAIKEDIILAEHDGRDVVIRFEKDLSLLHARNDVLERSAKDSDTKIDELEKELAAQRRRHKEQLQRRDATISRLGNELEDRARTIARLTSQIHRAGLKAGKDVENAEFGGTDSVNPVMSSRIEHGGHGHRHPGYRSSVGSSLDSQRRTRGSSINALSSRDDGDDSWGNAASGTGHAMLHDDGEVDAGAFAPRPPGERPASARSRPTSASSVRRASFGASRPTSAATRIVPPLAAPDVAPETKYGVLPPINPSSVWATPAGGELESVESDDSNPLPPPTPPPASSSKMRRFARVRSDGQPRLAREVTAADAFADDVNGLSGAFSGVSLTSSGRALDNDEGAVVRLVRVDGRTSDAKKPLPQQHHA
eukprot:Opistho-2@46619